MGRYALFGRCHLPGKSLLPLVVSLGSDLSLLLQSADNVVVLPAELLAQTSDGAVLPSWLQPQDSQSLRNNHALLGVVWGRNTLEDLEPLKSSLATGSLVGNHTTDGLVENPGGGTEVEGTVSLVETGSLAEVCMILQLSTEEFAGNVQRLAADNDDLLAVQKLLGDGRSQTTKEMSFTINDDDFFEV